MKLFCLFFFSACSVSCLAQPKLTHLTKTTLPKGIKYSGNLFQAVRWTDSAGNNIVVLSRDEKKSGKPDEDFRDGSIYAYHFLVSGDSIKQTWKIYDFEKDCPFDLSVNFIDKTFAVTDLNKDGKGEIWMMYEVVCRSDISPAPLKIIMFENDKKYAVRGNNQVPVSETEREGGEFSFDDAFKKGPVAFREYAEKLWNKNKYPYRK